MISDPRRLAARLSDAIWVRIIDLPAALAARRYATDVNVVLEVTDEWIPANSGRWRLIGSPAGATCVSTVDEPDLVCDIRAVGAAYLGGSSLTSLTAAGLVREVSPDTLGPASIAFSGWRAPSSMEVF
jgi:predicted acetyltransferase